MKLMFIVAWRFFLRRVLQGKDDLFSPYWYNGRDYTHEFSPIYYSFLRPIHLRINKHNPKVSIKVVTWNIQLGEHLFGVLDVLKCLEADVICLQEVREKHAEFLARQLAMDAVFGCEFIELHNHNEKIGNMILAKLPFGKLSYHVLASNIFWQKNFIHPCIGARNAIGVTIENLHSSFHVISTHFEIYGFPQDRELQALSLLDSLPDGKIIISGDFNTIFAHERVGDVFRQRNFNFVSIKASTKYPFIGPLDVIYIRNGVILSYNVMQTSASDHYPIIAEIQ